MVFILSSGTTIALYGEILGWMSFIELNSALELRNLLLEVLRGSEFNPTFLLGFIHYRMDSERCSAFLNVPLPADVLFFPQILPVHFPYSTAEVYEGNSWKKSRNPSDKSSLPIGMVYRHRSFRDDLIWREEGMAWRVLDSIISY